MDTVANATAGLRRLSHNHAQLLERAGAFAGLPDGVSRYDLLHQLKRAAPQLGFPTRLVSLMEYLVQVTSECDWQGYEAPVAWPSNYQLMARFGISRTAVKDWVRLAQRAGLVLMRDSENGKRYGQRDKKTGLLLSAYGFDLSPMASRYEEFVALGDALELQHRQRRQLRRSVTADRREVRRLAADAIETGLGGYDWDAALVGARHTDTRDYDLAHLQALADRVREARQAVEKAWLQAKANQQAPQKVEESDPTGADERPHILPTTERKIEISRTYEAFREDVAPGVDNSGDDALDAVVQRSSERIRVELVIDALPELTTFMSREGEGAGWRDVHAAAMRARHVLKIHPRLWTQAVQALGIDNASAAMGYTLANHLDGRLHGTPGGYFHGLVERARSGQLHLRDSLWGKLGRPKCAAAKEAYVARRSGGRQLSP